MRFGLDEQLHLRVNLNQAHAEALHILIRMLEVSAEIPENDASRNSR